MGSDADFLRLFNPARKNRNSEAKIKQKIKPAVILTLLVEENVWADDTLLNEEKEMESEKTDEKNK